MRKLNLLSSLSLSPFCWASSFHTKEGEREQYSRDCPKDQQKNYFPRKGKKQREKLRGDWISQIIELKGWYRENLCVRIFILHTYINSMREVKGGHVYKFCSGSRFYNPQRRYSHWVRELVREIFGLERGKYWFQRRQLNDINFLRQ